MQAHQAMKILTKEAILEETDDLKLLIGYDPESDTLSLWNGTPANCGETVAQYLTAESNSEGIVNRDKPMKTQPKYSYRTWVPGKAETTEPGTTPGETRPS